MNRELLMISDWIKKLKRLSFILALSFFSQSILANYNALFNPDSGKLTIPNVRVGIDEYAVEMQQTEGFTFQLSDAVPIPIDYRQQMREFVISISEYANREKKGKFLIIPQNGQELMTDTGGAGGVPNMAYLQAIDASGRESLFYGYDNNDDEAAPPALNQSLISLGQFSEKYHIEMLVTDYCSTPSNVDDSYQLNEAQRFISFAANERDLTDIPAFPATVFNENSEDITHISEAKNFFYLLNAKNYPTKQDFMNAVAKTNYDVLIIDIFLHGEAYTESELRQLQEKENGAKRLVVGYLSIGEAEDYRYYWQQAWNETPPLWLESENVNWAGNYKVNYWDAEWQAIIFGNDSSYVKKAIDSGFDGIYLDIIDAFYYFEQK